MLLYILGLFVMTIVLVGVVLGYAQQFLIDKPCNRSLHAFPTPRGGGIASVIAFAGGSLCLFALQQISFAELGLVFAATGVALIGFWDDHHPLPAKWRLLAHFCAACFAVNFIERFSIQNLPHVNTHYLLTGLGFMVASLFLTWILNLFNFMDGIDGIAATEASFVSLSLAWFMQDMDAHLTMLALSLAAVSLGFLVWNWPPAKIFMGDVGSGFIGFMLGLLILLFSLKNPVFGFIGLILFAIFIVDTAITLLTRYFTGQIIFEAHCLHAYQKAAKAWGAKGHLKVVLCVVVVNLCYLFPLAWLAFHFQNYAPLCGLLAYLPLIYLALKLKAGIIVNE